MRITPHNDYNFSNSPEKSILIMIQLDEMLVENNSKPYSFYEKCATGLSNAHLNELCVGDLMQWQKQLLIFALYPETIVQ